MNIDKVVNKILLVLMMILVIFAVNQIFDKFVSISAKPMLVETNVVSESKVLIYFKDGCRFCLMAKDLLQENGLHYESVDLSHNKDLHLKLANQTGQNTVPYVFINQEFVGGYVELKKLIDSGFVK